ncbi:MAG: glycosyltransferase family 9 protein, partial [candidate division FCPU426 bacterium]
LAACLADSALVVANDSGPLHIAAALARPSVGLYGPVDPVWSRPLGGRSRVLYSDEPCSPCYARSCPLGHHHCMEHILPDQVLAAAMDGLKA